jgi:anaerobic ribonucleoside-triphosphate reductase activating protein
MLKYVSYDVVFREIPDETTLALNISGCPYRCSGCHSPWLQSDVGQPLTDSELSALLNRYGSTVTCVCFMGGDEAPDEVVRLATLIRRTTSLKVGWYSGRVALPPDFPLRSFHYIKLGPYIDHLGPLFSPTTNQRLYRITAEGAMMAF